MSSTNDTLNTARSSKYDEFYTRLSDVEKEMNHYAEHFKGKTVLCNCNDTEDSAFWQYFRENFEKLGLKKIIAVGYSEEAYRLEYSGEGRLELIPLKGNGDFRSQESVDILREADIVVTNPPFSLFREYVSQLFQYDKKFVILGDINSLTCKDLFPLIQDNKMWLGVTRRGSGDMWFKVPPEAPYRKSQKETAEARYQTVGRTCWFTNLDYPDRYKSIPLTKTYDPACYAMYDGYDAIEVSRVSEIPSDYEGIMGVPITFLSKHCPEQFEILGIDRDIAGERLSVNGRRCYARILIRRRKLNEDSDSTSA